MTSVEAVRDAERCDAGVQKRVGPSFFCFCQHTGVRRPPSTMLYKAACSVWSNAKAILKKILGSGEANGKAKVMFIKNMVRCSVLFCYVVLILP
jgi:hypothetical protein